MRLRIYWIPQVPMTPFFVDVNSLADAKLLLNTLAAYDKFQLDHSIKPDYSNAGGLQMFDPSDDTDSPDGSWCDWADDDGRSIDDVTWNECVAIDAKEKRT